MAGEGQFVRIGFADGSQSSGFKIEGRGEVVDCKVVNEQTPFTDETSNPSGVKCGYAITVQYLDANWNPTDAEPVTEFLSAGPVEKFHPGQADSPTGEAKDMGEEPEAAGNVLLCGVGKEPDKKSKLYKFGASCQKNGLDKSFFDGFAPRLVGLKANFWQEPQPRGQNQKEGSADPTCLAIKQGEIFHKPGAVGTSAPAKGKAAAAKGQHSAPTPAPAAPAASASGDMDDDTVSARAIAVLQKIAGKFPGETLALTKLMARASVTFIDFRKDADNPIPTAMDKLIQGKFKNSEWLKEVAEGLDIVINGDQVTLPKA